MFYELGSAWTEVTPDTDSFYHFDELVIGEEDDEIGQVEAELPLVLLDHDYAALHDILELVDK